jgi:hypothetical protein
MENKKSIADRVEAEMRLEKSVDKFIEANEMIQ